MQIKTNSILIPTVLAIIVSFLGALDGIEHAFYDKGYEYI
jgi:hypothetical protein